LVAAVSHSLTALHSTVEDIIKPLLWRKCHPLCI